ncbi:MAG TPA: HEAT repeat domain-containing protein [Steroidobacteraceae bacterium]|jgi:hypothetical protein|nr:HEAT repeat domain-containing protein [Steroidobacteraceae bacterium]
MGAWSTTSKVSLAVAVSAVFAGVVMVAGGESRAQPSHEVVSREAASRVSQAQAQTNDSAGIVEARPSLPPDSETLEIPTIATEAPPDTTPVAELSRLVMPLDETTAEENEQRGDAIRQLGASTHPESVPALVYALRNDIDVRNRILAINALLRAGLAGNTDPAIADALAEASRSDDEVVASQAQQALTALDRH